eukprot:CAMPEP_0194043358 /NCGR_PEP_ID=MMETSP0009_2-20130614/15009_1 /TAXON_ID=210454 /ORGANISM="Grammatophora oceanica, Strain CCMP 410" /LENGTH=127 /DNA_ID=CAMNT_0038687543 /DNA_START=478 /DNA_END=858 /DNA_ORIENTATION=+
MTFGSLSSSSFVRNCGVVALICAAWNLLGDLYYMDFFTAHNSEDEFGMLRQDLQSEYLFNLVAVGSDFSCKQEGGCIPSWPLSRSFHSTLDCKTNARSLVRGPASRPKPTLHDPLPRKTYGASQSPW